MASGEGRRRGDEGEKKWDRQPISVPSWAVSGLSRNMNFFIATTMSPHRIVTFLRSASPPPM